MMANLRDLLIFDKTFLLSPGMAAPMPPTNKENCG